jgi:shikimate 5-dehydrogenase
MSNLIGAINTLVIKGEGSQRAIIGDNTDCFGLYNIMAARLAKTPQKSESHLLLELAVHKGLPSM